MTLRLSASGFREYDARWQYPEALNAEGARAVGMAIATQMRAHGMPPEIVVGHDFRSYSKTVQNALIDGLVAAGANVSDIGLCLSPTAYFAQGYLGVDAVAMVTASHNPNGWTGVKVGFEPPCTHGPEEMRELAEIALSQSWTLSAGGRVDRVCGVKDAYLDDLVRDAPLTRALRVVCATGNGTAGAFAPELLRRLGVEVIERHCKLDHAFPNYNPNPEALEMLDDMARAVQECEADFALGFDGDGDRCGVVDHNGQPVSADKLGLILARDLSEQFDGAHFVVDVKSTGLFATDPVLRRNGASVEYWKTGHSHMKRRVRDVKALAGFEKSGHHFIAPPLGGGYDCALRVAVELCRLLDRRAEASVADLLGELEPSWISPTLSPYCADDLKYGVVERLTDKLTGMMTAGEALVGRRIVDISTVNGARVRFADGSWALVRASSNTPNLVVVCESLTSDAHMRELFADFDRFLRQTEKFGAYDQYL